LRYILSDSLDYMHIPFVLKGLKKYPSLIGHMDFNAEEKKDMSHYFTSN